MSILKDDLKEQQKINELQRKIEEEKEKLEKKTTRQKILLGAFLVDMLEKDAVPDLKKYVAENLGDYLTRKTDKDLLNSLVVSLGGQSIIEEEKTDDFNHQPQPQYNL